MSETIDKKAEKIKKNIKGTAEKSKETIRQFISTNMKNVGEAIESNKKIVDYSIEEETIFDERNARVTVPKRLLDDVLNHNFTSPSNIYKKEFPYHANYWRSSNKNVKTRLFRDVKNDLQKHMPLEKQFEENGIK